MTLRSLLGPLAVSTMVLVIAGAGISPSFASRRPRPDVTLMAMSQTASGSFLAGRLASSVRDNQSAATFFAQALKGNPANLDLLDRTFLALLSSGQIDQAMRYATRLIAADKGHRFGQLTFGVRSLRGRQYALARQHFDLADKAPVLDLISPLLTAWAYAGAGDIDTAIAEADKLKGEDWYNAYRDFAVGLMLDMVGQHDKAIALLQPNFNRDPTAVRVAETLARALARAGRRDDAMKVLQTYDAQLPGHPIIRGLMADIKSGRRIPPTVRTPQEGAADILIGLAGPLAKQGGADYALVFYQLALYLYPDDPPALVGLAALYDALNEPDLAVQTFQRVPSSSPLKHDSEIQMAISLDELDRTDDAIAHLKRLIAQDPKDLTSITALGNIYQARKRYPEAADTFTQAIAAVPTPTRDNWSLFYFRGIAFERTKQWPKAEADFKKALELFPDQPSVLNYLGYSWIDQGINYDQGMAMIKKAVDQRPDDGYIIDSFGWAYFKLGKYDDAVKTLEHAVELKPGDATINDHLGDAYWKAGRKLEATFQWNHARDSKPDADELATINQKLKEGLKDEKAAQAPKVGSGG